MPAAGKGASSALGRHHEGLDGLRGIGMTVVFLYHAGMGPKGSFLALSQFFTLSGFLVASMLVRGHDRGGIDLKAFWVRRVRRLVPASLVALAGVAVFGATVATADQADKLPAQMAASLGWVANWYTIVSGQSYVDLFAEPSPVDHIWSLSMEEQFYLLASFSFVLMARRNVTTRRLLLVLGGGTLLATVWTAYLYRSGASLDRLYLGTDTRLGEILLGSLLAVVVLRRPPTFSPRGRQLLGAAGTVAYIACLVLWVRVPIDEPAIWQGALTAYAGLTVVVILAILAGAGPVTTVTSLWPVAVLGRMSYGIYLFHWPLVLWLNEARTGLDGLALLALRAGATMATATVSYHLIETPIREGRWAGLPLAVRRAAMPVTMASVLAITWATVDRDAPDPSITFRPEDGALVPPVVPDDGVLDILAVHDATGTEIVARLAELGASDDAAVAADVVATPFACSALTEGPTGRTCQEWADSWPALVEEHDPDVVLFFVETWNGFQIGALTDSTELEAQERADRARPLLAAGFDMLVARGAPVVFVQPVTADMVGRGARAFDRAMAALADTRDDIRVVLDRLLDPAAVPHDEYVDTSARVLLADLSLYQRAERDRLPTVMVVGDSAARSLAFGLEHWAAATERAVVWNAAVPGCGVVVAGEISVLGRPEPVDQRCRDAVAAWPDHIAAFDPDLVVVLTTAFDPVPRRLPGGDDFLDIDDPELVEFLREEYAAAIDTLGAGGAHVRWLTVPCNGPVDGGSLPDTLRPEVRDALNDDVIGPVVAAAGEGADIFDLDAILCPGGEALQSVDGVDSLRPDGVHFSVDGSLWFADTHGEDLLAPLG